jgi:CrcB protein
VTQPRFDLLPAIAAGGAIGSLARWGVASAVEHPAGAFAWSTLIVNLSGAFALAVLVVTVTELWPTHVLLAPFFGVGVLGGFTTFSTWMLDTHSSWVDHPATALTYLGATLVGGLLAPAFGLAATRWTLTTLRGAS